MGKGNSGEHAVEIADRIWWVGHVLDGDSFQCHSYLVENGEDSVLIDPGSKLTFAQTLRKVEEVIPFSSIRWFVCHHQDPDITGSLPLIDQMISRDDARIVSHWRAIALLKHYGFDLPMICVEENGWQLDLGGRILDFVFTPYLHFPGAFATFDAASGILFSSDLFGGFTEEWSLYAQDRSYFESIRLFHEHYMPSREILLHFLSKLDALPLKTIAPQHGSIIEGELVPYIISRLRELDCGLFLMTRANTEVHRLSTLNRFLSEFLQTLVTERDFAHIAKAMAENIQHMLPITGLGFFANDADGRTYHLDAGLSDRGVADALGEQWQGDIGLHRGEWARRHGDAKYVVEHDEEGHSVLLIPLEAAEGERIIALAILRLEAETVMDEDTAAIIDRIVHPLAVAAEREIILRTLSTERQKLYEQAIRDPLTGLYTRLYLGEAVERIFAIQDREPGSVVALLMTDIDHFKRVNDTYGHQAGDSVLRETAGIVLKSTRKGDIQVRFGGEEFAVVLTSATKDVATHIADRIRQDVEALRFDGDLANGRFTISIGVAFRHLGESLDSLVRRADMQLYGAKRNGRNQVCIDWSE
jgi:diguanylate cyclase (GGDEF)-like protein